MTAFGNGFSILLWVKQSCALTEGVSEEAAERVSRSLLQDACTLISMRWTMDVTIQEIQGGLYAFGSNTRITAGERTIRNALGDLSQHLGILRGTSHSSAEDLVRYKTCKEKWKVPENVTESSSGWEPPERPETSPTHKRRRFL